MVLDFDRTHRPWPHVPSCVPSAHRVLGSDVALMLSIPGPHVIVVWQASGERVDACNPNPRPNPLTLTLSQP